MNIQKVLVVEDETMFREFLVSWLRKEGYTIVGAASSLEEARRISRERRIDLILLDMDLPDGSGLEFIEEYSCGKRAPRILVLTAHASSYPVVKLKRSGAMGVLDKGETNGEELKRAFEALSAWRTYYSERVETAFRQIVSETGAFYKTLSPREEEMLKLFGKGYSNERIAHEMELSIATIQGHRRNVMGKVGVRSTPELIIWAIQNGFVNGPQIGRMVPVELDG